jgi:hypothetical protein
MSASGVGDTAGRRPMAGALAAAGKSAGTVGVTAGVAEGRQPALMHSAAGQSISWQLVQEGAAATMEVCSVNSIASSR